MLYNRWAYGLLCLCLICRDSHCKTNFKKEECDINTEDFTSATSSQNYSKHIFKEHAAGLSIRSDIAKLDRASGTDIHEVIFAVQQKNLDELTQILNDISDLKSIKYGQYMTKEAIADLTYDAKSHNAILQFLEDAGATVIAKSMHGEYITAHAPVSLWETVFHTEFFIFHHSHANAEAPSKVVRAEKYFVPLVLHPHVASVFHTIQMPMAIWGAPIIEIKPKVHNSSSIRGQVASGYTTPALLNTIYNIDSNIGNPRSTQAAFETIGQYFNERDLSIFQAKHSLPQQSLASKIGGHIDDKNTVCEGDYKNCMEANMDIQYLMAISQLSPTTHWYTGSNSFAAWLLSIANYPNPPLVLSISFGAPENTVSISEFEAFNIQAIKLGIMGISIVAASGGIVLHLICSFPFLLSQ